VQHIGMDRSFLSWCIPIFSIGRMFGSYCAGAAADKWNDDGKPTVACLIASIFGGAVYVMADMNQSWMLLLVAEFGMGLGGGTLATLRAHISKITTDKLRVSHTTYISTAQFAGLGLMPLVALGLNYYFIGPHHHEELANHRAGYEDAALMTAGGLLAEAVLDGMTGAAHDEGIDRHRKVAGGVDPEHFNTRPVRRSYHAGLENKNRGGFRSTSVHAAKQPAPAHIGAGGAGVGGRHLLSSVTDTALSVVGPATVHPSASPLLPDYTASDPSFLHRFMNHRTAPAHLIVALNLGCLLLYFMYFSASHESHEYQSKKAADQAKKRVAASLQASGGFDVDDVASGEKGAFEKVEQEQRKGGGGGGKKDAPVEKVVEEPSRRGKKVVKEVKFDVSKLDAMKLGGGVAAGEAAADGATADPAVSIVQVKDTTVITLAPFQDDAQPASSSASKSSSRPQNRSSSDDSDEEDQRPRNGGSIQSKATGAISTAGGVARGIYQLFTAPSKSRSLNQKSSGFVSSSSQSSRIQNYESGRARSDVDDEGAYLGGIHLTPERMVLWGSCLFVYLNYTIRGVLATVETVGTPSLAHFQHIPPGPLEVEASARFFGILGLLGCVVFFFQWYFQDYIDEPTSLIAGFVVTVTGSTAILVMPESEAGFTFGCVCIWSFGLPAVQNSVLAALSRILGTRPQGTWMGWIQTFGSLGRVTFPLIAKMFGVPFAFFLSSMGCGIAIVALVIYMRLVKMTM
jgi:MFS family permease